MLAIPEILSPLELWYTVEEERLPEFHFIEKDAIPQPYCDLLVHEYDMTTTLRRFHMQPISLRALHSHEDDRGDLTRMVLLLRQNDEVPVEFGAIRIHLNHLPEASREMIREGKKPFGRILDWEEIHYSSHPQAFFKVAADGQMVSALQTEPGEIMYGRCNELRSADDGSCLAEIVEILPPVK